MTFVSWERKHFPLCIRKESIEKTRYCFSTWFFLKGVDTFNAVFVTSVHSDRKEKVRTRIASGLSLSLVSVFTDKIYHVPARISN